jgi:hypothetical protein
MRHWHGSLPAPTAVLPAETPCAVPRLGSIKNLGDKGLGDSGSDRSGSGELAVAPPELVEVTLKKGACRGGSLPGGLISSQAAIQATAHAPCCPLGWLMLFLAFAQAPTLWARASAPPPSAPASTPPWWPSSATACRSSGPALTLGMRSSR